MWPSPLASPYSHTTHDALLPCIPKDLQQATFIFVRLDTHHTPLQHPYEGPYELLQPGLNIFKTNKGGKPDTISVDRLKAAHIYLKHSSIQHTVPQPRRQLRQIPQAIPADTTPSLNPDSPSASLLYI